MILSSWFYLFSHRHGTFRVIKDIRLTESRLHGLHIFGSNFTYYCYENVIF